MKEKKLLKSIEKLRRELNELSTEIGFLHNKILHKSQELDKLLNKYYKDNCNISNK